MKRIVLATTIAVTVAGAAMAQQARPLSETVISFEQRGYDIRSAENDGRSHEIEAITPDGRRIEAIVDAATGEVLSEHPDD
ncbi:MAG: PepSY domain-containing protein [Paracoccus sp. (in: a-proteobacteria)]